MLQALDDLLQPVRLAQGGIKRFLRIGVIKYQIGALGCQFVDPDFALFDFGGMV